MYFGLMVLAKKFYIWFGTFINQRSRKSVSKFPSLLYGLVYRTFWNFWFENLEKSKDITYVENESNMLNNKNLEIFLI